MREDIKLARWKDVTVGLNIGGRGVRAEWEGGKEGVEGLYRCIHHTQVRAKGRGTHLTYAWVIACLLDIFAEFRKESCKGMFV